MKVALEQEVLLKTRQYQTHSDAAGGRLSGGGVHCCALVSQIAASFVESSGFDLDDMNCPLLRCILQSRRIIIS